MNQQEQVVVLRPDKRHFWVSFAFGYLTIPLLGLGFWILSRCRRRWEGLYCRITNSDITLVDQDLQTTIRLVDVVSCSVTRSKRQLRSGLGNLVIRHSQGTSVFPGLSDPDPVAELIERGARSELERLKMREEVEKAPKPPPSGTLERKNDLVGLWQQGLISEEDYRRELKKFE